MNVLVTGCAGFIGSHLTDQLLKEKNKVFGVDNFNDYYSPKIKAENLKGALKNKNFRLYEGDILDFNFLLTIFKKHKFDVVIHLAARAGVRPSLTDPILYAHVNKIGTLNLLALCAKYKVIKFIFASSSSVYGNSKNVPFSEEDICVEIISPYGASKRSAEYFVESYSKIYDMKSTILRFFTVYGPKGRPDMAPAIFTNSVLSNKSIKKYGDGDTSRDYTYIDDIIRGIIKSMNLKSNFEIINLGNNSPVSLNEFIATIESVVGRKAKVEKVSMPKGDVLRTWANIDKARKLLDWSPKVNISDGLRNYVLWLKKN